MLKSLFYRCAYLMAFSEYFAMKSVKVCRFKTFWVRYLARRTLLPSRCFSIHAKINKMCILLRCDVIAPALLNNFRGPWG